MEIIKSKDRLSWLDALRGVAILGVVLVHCGQRPLSSDLLANVAAAGQYGVQLFFIVSAITISMTYAQHVAKYGTSPRSACAWLVRRLFRIWPLYAIATALYLVEHTIIRRQLGAVVVPPTRALDIAANLLLINPWIASANTAVPGGWSIGVEALFYCLFPMLIIWRRCTTIFAVLAIVLLAISECISFHDYGTFAITNNSYLYFWPPTQLPVILIGCAFYATSMAKNRAPNVWACTVLFAALSAVGLWLGTWGGRSPGIAPTMFALAFICLALLVASNRLQTIVSAMLSKIGLCSYSIYLVHFAVLDVSRLIVKDMHLSQVQTGPLSLSAIFFAVAGVSYFLASVTRRLIEIPSIELGRHLSRRMLRPQSHANS